MTTSTPLFKRISLLLGVVVAIALGVLAWRSYDHATLAIASAPLQTTVSVDGQSQTFSRSLSLNLTGGSHKLVFTKTGFQTKTVSLSLKPQATTTYAANLTPLPLANQIVLAGQAAANSSFTYYDPKNIEITQSQAFENQTWVVAIGQFFAGQEPSAVVLRRQNDELRLVGGPTAILTSSDTLGYPASVQNYLVSTGHASK